MADSLGALVGWTSQDLGSRVALKIECVTKAPPHVPEDIHAHLMMMDKVQALQLGHYLCTLAGQAAPVPAKRNWIDWLFRPSE